MHSIEHGMPSLSY